MQLERSTQESAYPRQTAYWLNKLANCPRGSAIPYDLNRNTPRQYVKGHRRVQLDHEVSESLLRLSKGSDISVYLTACALLKFILHRCSREEDTAIIGYPINANGSELLFYDQIDSQDTFKILLLQVRETVINANENRQASWRNALSVGLADDVFREPYFGIACLSTNLHKDAVFQSDRYDFQVVIDRSDREVSLEIWYNTFHYAAETINNWLRILKHAFQVCLANPSSRLYEFPLQSKEDESAMLAVLTPAAIPYPGHETLQALFVNQANMNPDDIALRFQGKYWTYRALLQRTAQIATYLKGQGIGPEDRIAVVTERGADAVIGILSTLMAGAAYVPIDPEYPNERVEYILMDSSAAFILTQSHLLHRFGEKPCLSLDTWESEKCPSQVEVELLGSCSNLAYVMYTSGTSGTPKGVLVEHRHVINTLYWFIKRYEVGRGTNVLQMTNLVFDPSIEQMFGSLLTGATLHCIPKDILLDKRRFLQYVRESEIHLLNFTPSSMKVLFTAHERIPSVRSVICGGEALDEKLKDEVLALGYQLHNHYGPTEVSIDALACECILDQPVMLGKPVSNTMMYVMDETMQLQPFGAVGELCIAGKGLSRGYLNDTMLTVEKFVDNPYLPGQKLYRTGDIVRWLTDGSVEYIGRMDSQTKIRGIRIELREVESLIQRLAGVEEAIVIAKTDSMGEKELHAYLTFKNSSSIQDENLIKERLSSMVPNYMMPSQIYILDQIPLNANGKVNYSTLRALEETQSSSPYEPPQTEIEFRLARLWSDILGKREIGVKDNFFEHGGNSLRATRLIASIYQEFQVEYPLDRIFVAPTIRVMATELEHLNKSIYQDIPKQEKLPYYPASSPQKRLYFLRQLEGMEKVYNRPVVFQLTGEMNVERLEHAIKALIARHESLRTAFELVGNEVVQRIYDEVEFAVEYEEFTGGEPDALIEQFIRPFDLGCAPLFRCRLSKLEKSKYILQFDMHHIIADGISTSILMEEYLMLYQNGENAASALQYKDYTMYLQQVNESRWSEMERFWMDHLSGSSPIQHVPADFTRPAIQSTRGDQIEFELDPQLSAKVRQMGSRYQTTLFMVLLAAFNVLLSKYSGESEVIIGTPVAGRRHPGSEKIVGMLANTIALRHFASPEKSFIDLLTEVKQNALQAFEYQEYPFEQIVDKLSPDRDLSRNPLFDTMFVLHNVDNIGDILEPSAKFNREINDIQFEPINVDLKSTYFDLFFEGYEINDIIRFRWMYSTDLYASETMERLSRHFVHLLTQLADRPEERLADLHLLTASEREFILNECNFSDMVPLPYDTVNEWFETQALDYGENVALVHGVEKLTYKELDVRSNQIAHWLYSRGITTGTVVGIMLDRSIEMPVTVLGIMKAGAICLPLNPLDPAERNRVILSDALAELVITHSKVLCRTEIHIPCDYVALDAHWESVLLQPETALSSTHDGEDAAYIVYTSGSTGKPKGVLMKHTNLVNLIHAQNLSGEIDFRCKILQYANLTFDVAMQELCSALLNGGELHIVDASLRNDLSALLHYVKVQSVEVVFLPSALVNYMFRRKEHADGLRTVKHIIVAGEALMFTEGIRHLIKEYGVAVHNHYGPSETHVVTTHIVDPESDSRGSVPIGKPIANVRVYIMNDNMQLQPPGIIGELCIGGQAVGAGYVGMPELMEQKFIANPESPGEWMYRTGDLARWLPDGKIEFLGRIDRQLKIKGYRIEPADIEWHLMQHSEIRQAVVVDAELGDDVKGLAAFMVCDGTIDLAEIKRLLAERLPSYMIPEHFVIVEDVPLTANGKVNKQVLLSYLPNTRLGQTIEENALSEAERTMSYIWRELLGMDTLGILTHFFQAGGDSLKAMMLIMEVNSRFRVNIPLHKLFQAPVLRDFTAEVEAMAAKGEVAVTTHNTQHNELGNHFYPVSFNQKRLAILDKLGGESIAYNLPAAFAINGEVDLEKLNACVKRLVDHHESLRTSFIVKNGKVEQIIHDRIDIEIEQSELNGASDEDTEALIRSFVKPFSLDRAPLFRLKHVRMSATKSLLLWDMHHVISDGISLQILLDNLSQLYSGNEIQQLNFTYRDYAGWQNEALISGAWEQQEEFWLSQFATQVPLLELPMDFTRPDARTYSGDKLEWVLSKSLTGRINQAAIDMNVTPFMFLLTAYYILLYRFSGQEDITVGTAVSNRNYPGSSEMVGNFVNTLALRQYFRPTTTVREFLVSVREGTVEAFENVDYPFELLVDKLNLPRYPSRHPLFDTMFTLHKMQRSTPFIEGAEVTVQPIKCGVSRFDVSVGLTEFEGEIALDVEYSTELFKKETMVQFGDCYLNILIHMLEHLDCSIATIDLLTPEDHAKLVQPAPTFTGSEDTVVDWFDRQVDANPGLIALHAGGRSLTYGELRERAEHVAAALIERGILEDAVVGIISDRRVELWIAMLGVLKAGGAFLLIDPETPAQRLEDMLQDSGVQQLITITTLAKPLPFGKWNEVDFEQLDEDMPKGHMVRSRLKADRLAYVIYTSGSTGKPKGVMIEHRSVTSFFHAISEQVSFAPGRKILALTSVTFDIFILEALLPLVSGMEIVIADSNDQRDYDKLSALISHHNINMLQMTPSRLTLFLKSESTRRSLSNIADILIGGESLPLALCRVLMDVTSAAIHNVYGPTEATIWCAIKRIESADDITIGLPLSNTKFRILDKYGQPVPSFVPGELYIAGLGLARGYMTSEVLTAERFVPDLHDDKHRMYRTGDAAKWTSSGEVILLGRLDRQVKVRGYRIELGEIEAQIAKHPDVEECAVIQSSDSPDEMLGFYVTRADREVTNMYAHLSLLLPRYMLPDQLLELDVLPLTSNGKVDYHTLARYRLPESKGTTDAIIESEWQGRLLEAWSSVLRYSALHVNDNVFEHGANSLKVIDVYDKLADRLPGHVTIADFFAYPTIRLLAEWMEQSNNHTASDRMFTLSFKDNLLLNDLRKVKSNKVQVRFPSKLKEGAYHYAESLRARLEDTLRAVLAYTLYEVTEDSMIAYLRPMSERNKIFIEHIDFQMCEDIKDVIRLLSSETKNAEILSIPSAVAKTSSQRSLLYIEGTETGGATIDSFDLIMRADSQPLDIIIYCEYDVNRWAADTVKDLLKRWIRNMESLFLNMP